MSTLSLLEGPALVTLAYLVFWYYLLLIRQRGTKYRLKNEYEERGESFDRYFGQDEEMLAADRAVINTQEQMIPFLAGLWLHAIFVSTVTATYLGVIYITLRLIYHFYLEGKFQNYRLKRFIWLRCPRISLCFTCSEAPPGHY